MPLNQFLRTLQRLLQSQSPFSPFSSCTGGFDNITWASSVQCNCNSVSLHIMCLNRVIIWFDPSSSDLRYIFLTEHQVWWSVCCVSFSTTPYVWTNTKTIFYNLYLFLFCLLTGWIKTLICPDEHRLVHRHLALVCPSVLYTLNSSSTESPPKM